MKKMRSLNAHSKRDGGEFLTTLFPGDIFISFHHPSQDCYAFYVKRSDLSATSFDKIFMDMNTYFQNDTTKIECKMIGSLKSVDEAFHYLENNKIITIKNIEKDFQV